MDFNNKLSIYFSITWRQAKFNTWFQQISFETRTILDWPDSSDYLNKSLLSYLFSKVRVTPSKTSFWTHSYCALFKQIEAWNLVETLDQYEKKKLYSSLKQICWRRILDVQTYKFTQKGTYEIFCYGVFGKLTEKLFFKLLFYKCL